MTDRAASDLVPSFDLAGPLPTGVTLLEASAGTGKTYALTALVARYIAEGGLRIDEILLVTFARAAARELKEQVGHRLEEALAALDATEVTVPWLREIAVAAVEEREVRRERLEAAVNGLDGATVTTIHGFFQSALAELGLLAGDVGIGDLVSDDASERHRVLTDRLLQRLAARPTYLDEEHPPSSDKNATPGDLGENIKRLVQVVETLAKHLAGEAAPPVADEGTVEGRWALLASEVAVAQRSVRRSAGVRGYDDLVEGMATLVDDPEIGPKLCGILRNRYRVALIDEFQDTDLRQWSVFSTVFAVDAVDGAQSMVLVGDPKQAIYRFRGADIGAYTTATAGDRIKKRRLTINWRSDADLVDALNRLMAGATFGSPEIAYHPVDARPGARTRVLTATGPTLDASPLQIRWVPTGDPKPTLGADEARIPIAHDLVNHIVALLSAGRIDTGAGSGRPVLASDICILVRARAEADLVIPLLRARGIPAVRSRVGSVLESEAVEELSVLFAALARPGDPGRVRALTTGWFVRRPAGGILDGDDLADLQSRCTTWARDIEFLGVAGFFQRFRADRDVLTALAAGDDVDRRLTDLEHAVELLHVHTSGGRIPASALLRALAELRTAKDDDAEVQARRTDTDAAAVQVTTIHSAKGLEYPIVLVPFPKTVKNDQPYVFNHDGHRYVDAAPGIAWTREGLTLEVRKSAAAREVHGDALRLLYVALTRARHQLVVWWASPKTASRVPLGRLLFGDTSALDESIPVLGDAAVASRLAEIAGRVGSALSVRRVDPSPEPDPPTELLTDAQPELVVAVLPANAAGSSAWSRWSYSSLKARGGHDDRPLAVRGGRDEPEALATEAGPLLSEPEGAHPPPGALESLPGGTAFGTFVHGVLEHLEFAADPLEPAIRAATRLVVPPQPWDDAATECLTAGIDAALATPLDVLAPGYILRVIRSADRLAELRFDFALGTADPVAVVAPAAESADPIFGRYFADLVERIGLVGEFTGLMTGSIDAVLRFGTGADATFSVVDYKTNRCTAPGPGGPYGRAGMQAEMERHDYPLQALVYTVALHRFLALRLEGYRPDRHLGPVGYLFVRGMIGPATPLVGGFRSGVFAWRPSTEVVLAVSAALGGRGV